ncbi:MAG: adenylosuccinate synthetase [Ruminococcus sp.]|nr:adenylosuccinate synthetase [Ruminococcus sp.]
MKKAYAVIGANFGDEGKGLMTDMFCRSDDNVINIRSNGGAQAGHTVCTSDGRRHVFSHIGAGSFAGADTFLSEYFILNPMLFSREVNALGNDAGNIFIDRRCAVTLPCDMLLNQAVEKMRGKSRHGSCGVGIFETIVRNRDSRYALKYEDMLRSDRKSLAALIGRMNRECCPARADELGITGIAREELLDILGSAELTEDWLDSFYSMVALCSEADEQLIEEYDTAVFEGAQGLMLDQDRNDYFPNLTPSSTGMKNIRAILDRLEKRDTEICYVTRSFFTRHGAGRFDTESKDIAEMYGLYDRTNAPNEFQGNFRYGWFDLPEFMASLTLDRRYIAEGEKLAVSVTHLDMTGGMVLCPTGRLMPEDIAYMAIADRLYKVSGETADDVVCQEVMTKPLARR